MNIIPRGGVISGAAASCIFIKNRCVAILRGALNGLHIATVSAIHLDIHATAIVVAQRSMANGRRHRFGNSNPRRTILLQTLESIHHPLCRRAAVHAAGLLARRLTGKSTTGK